MDDPRSSVGTIARSGRRVEFTPAARSAIAAVCWRDGPQAILLSWPAGAAYLPADCYQPDEFDVVIGHVEGCPVFTDARRLAMFPKRRVVLDADPSSLGRMHPPLHARVQLSWEPCEDLTPEGEDSVVPTASLVQRLMHELRPQFARVLSESEIATHVHHALDDLRGSVSTESLPEMAARLARHRLAAILRNADTKRPVAAG